MPVFQIYFHFYKTHIAMSRTHQHYCTQAIKMLKTGISVRTLVYHLKLFKAIFHRLQHHNKLIGINKGRH